MKLEALSFHDYSFLLDTQENNNTIIGVAFFEKFDYETIKQHLISKLEHIHKCKSVLVKKFGVYWFKEMSDQEWKQTKDTLFRRIDNVKNGKELNDLLCKEQAINDFINRPCYKFILIPDY